MRGNLIAARKRKKLTQAKMAEAIGVSLRYYQQIEQGARTGDVELWDAMEDITGIHQRVLREIRPVPTGDPPKHPENPQAK